MAAFLCAEEAGGCGVLWTEQADPPPVRDPEINPGWGWCPDCLLTGANHQEAG